MQRSFDFEMPVVRNQQMARATTDDAIERGEHGLCTSRSQLAIAAALRVAARREPFTTDDVWAELGAVPNDHDKASYMGSVMRHLSQGGQIKRTGHKRASDRPKQHRKFLNEWVAADGV